MDSFPEEVRFRGTWRTYQARLLENLEVYLNNKRLNIVAAPGSGKTVFGLEVVRRLNRRTLVLAPTLPTRDQWVDRLVGLFLAHGEACPDWVSTDLRQPALFTVATYQALHAMCSAEGGREEAPYGGEDAEGIATHSNKYVMPAGLAQAGFRTLVADEAHHLRAEWWRTLTFVAEQFDDPTVVTLTATPPYDVSSFEWRRYEEFCGPVDAEVSVPELVLQGDLCPHQDYVYFSTPAAEEQKTLSEFRAAVQHVVQHLRDSREFANAVASHPWIVAPASHMEEILDRPECLSSMVIYLKAAGAAIPKDAVGTLGLKAKNIPALDLDWLEILLSNCLYSEGPWFEEHGAILKTIRHDLLQIGAIEHRKVKLRNPSGQTTLLTMSATRLQSIGDIVRLESRAQADHLRCVILTDFIRKSDMPRSGSEGPAFEDIGVTPIFETLRQAGAHDLRLGVLTGSLVVIPAKCEPLLRRCAEAMGIHFGDLTVQPLSHDPAYAVIELGGEWNHDIVRLVTQVFEQGGVRVLVGTKSLLGEGWDAPTINTLILASFVGSYVLSNQMRGRSIRVDPQSPAKTANIWHLVCVEPGAFGPGEDYDLLTRRFSAFVGVSPDGARIENGTVRLGFGNPPFAFEQIAQMNRRTCERAQDRNGLRENWKAALAAGSLKQMTHGLASTESVRPRTLVVQNTIAAMVVQTGSTFFWVLFRDLSRAWRDLDLAGLGTIAGGAAIASLPWALRALWRFVRHGTPERSLTQIGQVVLEALVYAGSLDRKAETFQVRADQQDDGTVYCWISGGTQRDQTVFLDALREVLGPVENPRYLLARRRLWRLFGEDYFAVPDTLARKKDDAQFFAGRWRRAVGGAELIYTRTPEGRRMLLRARMHSLASAFQGRSDRVSCWK